MDDEIEMGPSESLSEEDEDESGAGRTCVDAVHPRIKAIKQRADEKRAKKIKHIKTKELEESLIHQLELAQSSNNNPPDTLAQPISPESSLGSTVQLLDPHPPPRPEATNTIPTSHTKSSSSSNKKKNKAKSLGHPHHVSSSESQQQRFNSTNKSRAFLMKNRV